MFGGNNFIIRFWRGAYSLGVSFWVFYIGFTLVFELGLKAVSNRSFFAHTFDPRINLAWLCCVFAVTYAIAIVQWVGVWRAARNGRALKRATGRPAIWSYIAQVVMVLSAANVARLSISSTGPTLVETYRTALAGDPSITPFAMRVTPDGTQILVFGGFKFGLTAEFLRLTAPLPNLRTVHLASAGGRTGEAKHLYDVIKAKGLDTYVADICYSACTIAFAGGKRRYLLKTGKLGFHSESFLGKKIADDGPFGERRAYVDAGFAPALIAKALSTPPSAIWKPTPEALVEDHVVTDIATSDQFAASDMGIAPSVAKIEGVIRNATPLLASFATNCPDLFNALGLELQKSYMAGESYKAFGQHMAAGIEHAVKTMLPTADDATMIDYARLAADEYTALLAVSPSACFDYIQGTGSKADQTKAFGPDLRLRQSAFSRAVIDTKIPHVRLPDAIMKPIHTRFIARLAKAAPLADLKAMGKAADPSQHAGYCRGMIVTLQTMASLPPSEAGAVIRDMLSTP